MSKSGWQSTSKHDKLVEEIRNSIAVVAGDEVIISRPKKKAFVEALAEYYNQ